MTYSRRSTSSALGAVIVALLPAGCHGPARTAPPIPVTADLGALVRVHPGWAGVALYDRMIARLRTSARQAQAGLPPPAPPLTLPGLSGLDLPGGGFALPAGALDQQRLLLAQLGQRQMERLRERRAQARDLQVRALTRVWRREARQRYDLAVADADARYAGGYGDALAADAARRLNLALQISALAKTVGAWTPSVPPTPLLDRARRDLAAKRQELALLDARQSGSLADLLRARAAARAPGRGRPGRLRGRAARLDRRAAAGAGPGRPVRAGGAAGARDVRPARPAAAAGVRRRARRRHAGAARSGWRRGGGRPRRRRASRYRRRRPGWRPSGRAGCAASTPTRRPPRTTPPAAGAGA